MSNLFPLSMAGALLVTLASCTLGLAEQTDCVADDDCVILGTNYVCEEGFCAAPSTDSGSNTPCETMVCDNVINVGTVSAQTGPNENLGTGMTQGTKMAFWEANQAGGVMGRRLELIVKDDKYEPIPHAEEMEAITKGGPNRKVLAVIGNVGTPTAAVGAPIAVANDVVLHGLFTGAGLLRKDPPDKVVFNYRASYVQETVRMVNYLRRVRDPAERIPAKNIGAFPQGCSVTAGGDDCPYDGSDPAAQGRADTFDPFGAAGWAGIKQALAEDNISEDDIPKGTYTRNTDDITAARDHYIETWFVNPDASVESADGVIRIAIIGVPTAGPTAELIVALKAAVEAAKDGQNPAGLSLTEEELLRLAKVIPYVATVSFVGPDKLKANLVQKGGGELCTNVAVSQVVPDPVGDSAGAQHYQDLIAQYTMASNEIVETGWVSFEGYLQARLFIDALKNATSLDTDGLVDGFHSLQNIEYGIGTGLSFNQNDHQASDKTWGTELDKNCAWFPFDLDE
jgi:ABC-type branched-subunit amino acid transport system substrate-binding protein